MEGIIKAQTETYDRTMQGNVIQKKVLSLDVQCVKQLEKQ